MARKESRRSLAAAVIGLLLVLAGGGGIAVAAASGASATDTLTPVTGIDAHMAIGGTVSGVLTDHNGAPVFSAEVVVKEASLVTNSFTTSSGAYSIGHVPPGSYTVEFTDGQIVLDVPATVTSGQTTHLDAQLPAGGSVTGIVTDPQGVPYANAAVFVGSSLGTTDATGHYTVPKISAGTYTVVLHDNRSGGEAWPDKHVDGVVVTDGSAASLNIQFAPAAATIKGTITVPAGYDVTKVTPSIYSPDQSDADFAFIHLVGPDASGNYEFDNVPAAADYTVAFTYLGNTLPPTMYEAGQPNGTGLTGTPTNLVVAPSSLTTGINVAMAAGGQISGHLSVPAGTDCTALGVQVQPDGQYIQGNFTWGAPSVAANCDYVVSGIPTGSFYVSFFDNTPGVVDELDVDGVNVTAPNATHLDETLLAAGTTPPGPTGSISGTVYDASGQPLAGIGVSAEGALRNSTIYRAATSDASGHYTITGVPAASYTVVFDPTDGSAAQAAGYVYRLYDGQSNLDNITPVVVPDSSPMPTPVTPTAPTASTPSCANPVKTVTPPSQTGVIWQVNGVPTGVTNLSPGGSEAYIAQAAPGYEIAAGAQTNFLYANTFDTTACASPTPTPTPTPTPPAPGPSAACVAAKAKVAAAKAKLTTLKKHHASKSKITKAKKALTAATKAQSVACA